MSEEKETVEERPMTAQEVIARIRAARAEKESPKQGGCGGGGCSACSCGKNNA